GLRGGGAGRAPPRRSARLWAVGADPPPGAPCGGVCLVFGCAVAVGLWDGGAQPRVPGPGFGLPQCPPVGPGRCDREWLRVAPAGPVVPAGIPVGGPDEFTGRDVRGERVAPGTLGPVVPKQDPGGVEAQPRPLRPGAWVCPWLEAVGVSVALVPVLDLPRGGAWIGAGVGGIGGFHVIEPAH